ncbi:MAG: hypothetical protein M3Q06_01075 [Bacteroidota bacterium]|nr:hypothetical protein [Bacteroidota bacterium]
MSNPLGFVPADILSRLATGKPYTLLLLKKGENYGSPDSLRIVQAEHLPHLFRLQDEGLMSFSMPLTQEEGELAGIGVYNLIDKEAVKIHVEADTAVQDNIFTYELISCMGLQGSSLQ